MTQKFIDRWVTVFIIITIFAIFFPIVWNRYQSESDSINWMPKGPLEKDVPTSYVAASRQLNSFNAQKLFNNGNNLPKGFNLNRENRNMAIPFAYTVLVGGFVNSDAADRLVQQLQQAGYPAYEDSIQKLGKRSYWVKVGPVILYSEARDLQVNLLKNRKIKGKIVRYKPL